MAGSEKYHLEIQTHRKNPRGLVRNSYRQEGKVRHQTLCTLTGLSLEQLKIIQAALQDKLVAKDDFVITGSREYGASAALHALALQTGLDKAIYSRPSERWVKDCLAMIIGRVVYAGSKLSLSHCASFSALWEVCGITDGIDVDKDCYDAMDKLYARQEAIQRALAARHMSDGSLVLYDITSSYMEGAYANSDIVNFGYSRDKKKGCPQIVIALLCSKDGCPIATEVFKGNTKDETTVEAKLAEIKDKYGFKQVVFVGDRGMVTMVQYEKINHETVKVVSALSHSRIQALCETKMIQLDMFDEREIVEVVNGNMRYCLCKNPAMAEKERRTRAALVAKAQEKLEKIAASTRNSKYSKAVRAGRVLEKYNIAKFFQITGDGDSFGFRVDEGKIAEEQALDGCYVIFTDVPAESMSKIEAVNSYKRLIRVEHAFRSLKTTRLELRPVYHKKDDRIKCHVFICMLAYYLMWHMKQRLEPLFHEITSGKDLKYIFNYIMEQLKCIRVNIVEFCGVFTKILSKPSAEQKRILDFLGIKIVAN
jgi:transposase